MNDGSITYPYLIVCTVCANLTRSGCDSVPQYPICSSVKYDNMRQLCRATFQNNFRLANISDSQPHITNMCQVACPSQLWQATGTHTYRCCYTSFNIFTISLARFAPCG